MALPTSGITSTAIKNVLGAGTHNIGLLCTFSTVNKWSRSRPGYWTINANNVMQYVAPDGVSTDPRGIDPQTGSNIMGFKFGDFRGYNHSATAPQFYMDAEFVYTPDKANSTQSIAVHFKTGSEFNWKPSTSDPYRVRNNLTTSTYLYILDTNGNVLGGASLLDSNGDVMFDDLITVNFDITTPGKGQTVSKTYEAWFGAPPDTENHPYFALGYENGTKHTVTTSIHVQADPSITIVLDTGNSNDYVEEVSPDMAAGDTSVKWSMKSHVATSKTYNAVVDACPNGSSSVTRVGSGTVFLEDGAEDSFEIQLDSGYTVQNDTDYKVTITQS